MPAGRGGGGRGARDCGPWCPSPLLPGAPDWGQDSASKKSKHGRRVRQGLPHISSGPCQKPYVGTGFFEGGEWGPGSSVFERWERPPHKVLMGPLRALGGGPEGRSARRGAPRPSAAGIISARPPIRSMTFPARGTVLHVLRGAATERESEVPGGDKSVPARMRTRAWPRLSGRRPRPVRPIALHGRRAVDHRGLRST